MFTTKVSILSKRIFLCGTVDGTPKGQEIIGTFLRKFSCLSQNFDCPSLHSWTHGLMHAHTCYQHVYLLMYVCIQKQTAVHMNVLIYELMCMYTHTHTHVYILMSIFVISLLHLKMRTWLKTLPIISPWLHPFLAQTKFLRLVSHSGSIEVTLLLPLAGSLSPLVIYGNLRT